MNQPTQRQAQIIWKALTALSVVLLTAIALGVGAAVIWIATYLKSVLIPLAIAGIIAYLLEPVVDFLQAKRMPRSAAILLVFTVILVGLAGLVVFLGPRVYEESVSLVNGFPDYVNHAKESAGNYLSRNPDLSAQATKMQEWILAEWPNYSAQAAQYAWKALGSALNSFGLVLGLAVIPLYVFYFLRDQAKIESNWESYLPIQRSKLRDELIVVIREINKYMISFFRGQVVVAIILGVLTSIGLLIIGLKYALLIGLITAMFSIIPYLGVVLSVGPALIIAYNQPGGSFGYMALTGAVFAAVQMCEGFFISPKIMGDRTGLHPVSIIVAILVWSNLLGGLLGAILAVPLTATLKVLMFRYVWKGRSPE